MDLPVSRSIIHTHHGEDRVTLSYDCLLYTSDAADE